MEPEQRVSLSEHDVAILTLVALIACRRRNERQNERYDGGCYENNECDVLQSFPDEFQKRLGWFRRNDVRPENVPSSLEVRLGPRQTYQQRQSLAKDKSFIQIHISVKTQDSSSLSQVLSKPGSSKSPSAITSCRSKPSYLASPWSLASLTLSNSLTNNDLYSTLAIALGYWTARR